MDSTGFKITGMEDLKRVFANLTEMDRLKFFVDEFKPISKTIEQAMRSQTPVSSANNKQKKYTSRNHNRGNLRNSIGTKIAGSTIPVVYVNMNRKKAYDAWYNHIVIGGHKYGSSTVAPNPIVSRTWESIGSMITGQLENRLKNKLTVLMK